MRLPVSHGTRVYLLIVLALVLGIVIAVAGFWRTGLLVVGLSLIVAGFARGFIKPDHLGLLRLRTTWIDVSWLLSLGVLLVVLAVVIPPPLS